MRAPRKLLAAAAVGLAMLALAPPSPAQAPHPQPALPHAAALGDGRLLSERPYLKIKPGSEDRVWGQPSLLALLRRGARAAADAVPGSVALVGDLSARQGGPLSGHVSHQNGCDADIALFVADRQGQPVTLNAFEGFGGDGRSLSNPERVLDVYRNWLMLREWLSELRIVVSHVFISAELRELLLEYGRQSPEFARYVPLATEVLRPHPAHMDHFHLRVACPTGHSKP